MYDVLFCFVLVSHCLLFVKHLLQLTLQFVLRVKFQTSLRNFLYLEGPRERAEPFHEGDFALAQVLLDLVIKTSTYKMHTDIQGLLITTYFSYFHVNPCAKTN